MARMHSRKKGKAGSSRPHRTSTPEWTEYKKEEVEDLVVKLNKEGYEPSVIGVILRDQHGIPGARVISGKRVSTIMKEKGLRKELPEDLMNLIKRAVVIDRHLKANPKDKTSKRGLQLTESKIRRLIKYYKETERIPKDWSYSIDKAKLLVK